MLWTRKSQNHSYTITKGNSFRLTATYLLLYHRHVQSKLGMKENGISKVVKHLPLSFRINTVSTFFTQNSISSTCHRKKVSIFFLENWYGVPTCTCTHIVSTSHHWSSGQWSFSWLAAAANNQTESADGARSHHEIPFSMSHSIMHKRCNLLRKK